MSRTITQTYTSTVRLTSTSNDPISITSTGAIVPPNAVYALYGIGGSSQSWTIANAGVINSGTAGTGIQLGSAGNYVGASTVTN
jgi:hypothetical protein